MAATSDRRHQPLMRVTDATAGPSMHRHKEDQRIVIVLTSLCTWETSSSEDAKMQTLAVLDGQYRKLAHMAASLQSLLMSMHTDLRATSDESTGDDARSAISDMRDTIAEAIAGLGPLAGVDAREPFSV